MTFELQGLFDNISEARVASENITELITDVSDVVDKIKEMIGCRPGEIPFAEAMLSKFEDLILYVLGLHSCWTTSQMIIPTLTYVKTWCSKSLYSRVKDLVLELLTADEITSESVAPTSGSAGFVCEKIWCSLCEPPTYPYHFEFHS